MNICLLVVMNINQNSTLYYKTIISSAQCALFASSSLSLTRCSNTCFSPTLPPPPPLSLSSLHSYYLFSFSIASFLSAPFHCIGWVERKIKNKKKPTNLTRLHSDDVFYVWMDGWMDAARLLCIWFPISTVECCVPIRSENETKTHRRRRRRCVKLKIKKKKNENFKVVRSFVLYLDCSAVTKKNIIIIITLKFCCRH